MTDEVIKTLKISIKGGGKILCLLKNVAKSENLINIREKNSKITEEFLFCDGEDLIDIDLEKDYEIGDLVDNEGKIYIRSIIKANESNNGKEKSDSSTINKNANDNNNSNNIQIEANNSPIPGNIQQNLVELPKEVKKSNMNPDLIEFINKFVNCNEDLKQKLTTSFEENYLSSMDDLLKLKLEDFDMFKLPPLIKKKLIDELNNLKPKEDLTENDKKLITTIFKQDLPPEVIFDSMGATGNLQKQQKIKDFYFSLKKPVKPFPQNAKQLIVKTSENKTLPCYKYPEKQYNFKRYFTLLVMGETSQVKLLY